MSELATRAEQEAELAALIVTTLNLDVTASEIDPTAPLFGEGLGLDSIDVLEIALAISQNYGVQLRSDDENNAETFQSRGLTLLRMKSAMSCVDVPGRKTSATPCSLSLGISSFGTIPPSTTSVSFSPSSRNNETIRGHSVLWAPLRMETPTASTSSCKAAAAIISGVCRKPV